MELSSSLSASQLYIHPQDRLYVQYTLCSPNASAVASSISGIHTCSHPFRSVPTQPAPSLTTGSQPTNTNNYRLDVRYIPPDEAAPPGHGGYIDDREVPLQQAKAMTRVAWEPQQRVPCVEVTATADGGRPLTWWSSAGPDNPTSAASLPVSHA